MDSHEGATLVLIRAFLVRKLMRLSRVPVLSLDRHGLVYDLGGLLPRSPLTHGKMLRSSVWRLSAVHGEWIRHPFAVYPSRGHNLTTTFAARYRPCRLDPPGS